jgi:RES domain-containing protein
VRIIPSRYPTVDLFERVAGREDFAALQAVESLTNPRLRNERDAFLVPAEHSVFGPGSSYIMAPFTHLHPEGGRFNDATFGAFYAARDRATAVAESKHHREAFLARTSEPPMELEVRVLEARLDARMHDLRGMRATHPELYHPLDYRASQELARDLRANGSMGIVYESVRHEGGQCAAALKPKALAECRQAEHLIYKWDGTRIAEVFEKKLYRP